MAQIDLKYAIITVQDGTYIPGTVNFTAGYTAGATSMVITVGAAIVINVGAQFVVATETGGIVHTVTAHSETSGSTTSVTFTPALASTIATGAAITFGPNTLTLHIGEGNLSFTEHRSIIYVTDRGLLAYTRLGDQVPVDADFEFIWDFLTSNVAGGEPPTMKEALTNQGACSNWLSSATDKCQPYSVDVVVLYKPPCAGIDWEQITLTDFRYEDLEHSTKDAKVSVKGKCNILTVPSVRITPH